jgi:hypothetical protein
MQPGLNETPAERNVRIASEQGAIHPEAVVAILKPFDEPTAAGAMPFAIVGGQVFPLASAVTRLRDETPALDGLFKAGGKLVIRAMSHPQFLAIRGTTARTLLGLGPK